MTANEINLVIGGIVGGIAIISAFTGIMIWTIRREIAPLKVRIAQLEEDLDIQETKELEHYEKLYELLTSVDKKLDKRVSFSDLAEIQKDCPAREWVKARMQEAMTTQTTSVKRPEV